MPSNYTNNVRHKDRNICRSCDFTKLTICNSCTDGDMFEPKEPVIKVVPEHYQVKSNFTVHCQRMNVKRDATG